MIGLKRTVVRYYQTYTHQDYYQTVREGKRERERGGRERDNRETERQREREGIVNIDRRRVAN